MKACSDVKLNYLIQKVLGLINQLTVTFDTKLTQKQDVLTIDSEPILNSKNLVTSDGVRTAINELGTATALALTDKQDTLTFDTTPTADSTNPVTSGGVRTALDALVTDVFVAGTTAPENTKLLWIDTTATTGGLKYYNGSSWVHVPVAYT